MGLHDQTNVIVLTNFLTFTTTFVQGIPVLDLLQEEYVQSKLNSAIHVPITVGFYKNDTNAIPLARQIAQIFVASGFTNVTTGSMEDAMPLLGILMASNKTNSSGPIMDAYVQLCRDVGQPIVQLGIDTNIPDNDIMFCVATITNYYEPQRSQKQK
jgi:hypothetical protein